MNIRKAGILCISLVALAFVFGALYAGADQAVNEKGVDLKKINVMEQQLLRKLQVEGPVNVIRHDTFSLKSLSGEIAPGARKALLDAASPALKVNSLERMKVKNLNPGEGMGSKRFIESNLIEGAPDTTRGLTPGEQKKLIEQLK